MNNLIAGLERATKGSRSLDLKVGKVVGWHGIFTESLDAALTLVPEGWGWAVAELEKGVPSAVTTNMEPQIKPGTLESNPDKIDFRIKATTPALALCIVFLRARQVMEEAG